MQTAITIPESEKAPLLQKVEKDPVYLMRQVSKGSKRSLEILYQEYSAALHGVIVRIVKDHHLSEEVLQDTFLSIWAKASSYDADRSKVFTWMYQIARNKALNVVASKGYRQAHKTGALDGYDMHGATQSDLADYDLHGAVNTLDQQGRHLIDLAYFQGYSQAEISELTDVPLGTVKSRMRKALKDLRISLKLMSILSSLYYLTDTWML